MTINELRFTNHARIRMVERGITRDHILITIANPDELDIDDNSVKTARKFIDDRKLVVVFTEKNEIFLIITVYWFGGFYEDYS